VDALFVTEPKPTAEATEALWQQWHDSGDERARNRLILSYAPMVKYLAVRKVRQLPSHCNLEDLVSTGLLALIAAVDRFDPAKGATFEQYAWTRVAGSMIDELRRQDWAPRSLRRAGREIERTRQEWQAKHGGTPTDTELSNQLEITATELRSQLDGLALVDLVSLNAPTRGEDGEALVEIGDTVPAPLGESTPERAALANERSAVLKDAVSRLSEREQRILTLLYVHELEGVEVGRILGVSESRVSQLLGGIRRTLKHHIDSYDRGIAPGAKAA
jgi:RNA polymerase sigma factor for flagellar operon FliA